MPQLAKGGKWVFGWVVVGPAGEVRIPPEEYPEYGFQPGIAVVFMHGSRSSGGCGLGHWERLAGSKISLMQRQLGNGMIGDDGRIVAPPQTGFQPGEACWQ
jgi:hypothetical protein